MDEKNKLIIRTRRSTGQTQVVSARLPNDMVSTLDDISSRTGRSRNEILVRMIDFALDNLEIDADTEE